MITQLLVKFSMCSTRHPRTYSDSGINSWYLQQFFIFKYACEFAIVYRLLRNSSVLKQMFMQVINNSHQIKNRILLLTYIYRSLPRIYIKAIAKDNSEKEHIRWTINNLERTGYLSQKTVQPIPFEFLYLTIKGYRYVVSEILKGNEKGYYRYKESRSLLKPILNHSFLNFAFLWHFHKENFELFSNEIQLYEDSDINHCKFTFSYRGHDVLVSPDVILYMADSKQNGLKKASFVENDTGRETYKILYQKLIEYIAFAEEGMEKQKLSEISLYFIFLSKRRMEQLFYSPNGVVRYFALYNKTSRGIEVRMRYLLQTLQSKKMQIYLSTYDTTNPGNPYQFETYDLLSYLVKKEQSWHTFLSTN